MTEQEQLWVEQARAGDKHAFSRLVQAYQRPVYNLTYRMLGNQQEAEDAAQETFLRAYAGLRKYSPEHKFSTWLFSIANHHCIDRLRKRRMRLLSFDDNPVLQNLEGEVPRPDHAVLDGEQRLEIQALLNQLEPEYRMPLILRYWEDYSYEEIATTLQLTVAAVKSRLFRARQQIAKLYSERAAAVPPSGRDGAPGGTRSYTAETRTPAGMHFAILGV